MSDPFDAVIIEATKREAAKAARREQEKAERKQQQAARTNALAQQHAKQRRLDGFKEGFLLAVVKRVVRADWSPVYIRQIQIVTEAMVNPDESEQLPKIDPYHHEKILDIFAYGLRLAEEHGEEIPANSFYGQRLVEEREAGTQAKPAPIVYTPVPLRHRTMSATVASPTNVVDLKPAFTARTKKNGRRKVG